MAIPLYISLQSRLFRRKVKIDRNTKTISSSYLFSIQKRKVSYDKVFVSSIYLAGEIGRGTNLLFLCEERINKKTSKPYIVRHLRFYENDEMFLHDHEDYIEGSYSPEKSKQRKDEYKRLEDSLWRVKNYVPV